jgi:hypothetical protein
MQQFSGWDEKSKEELEYRNERREWGYAGKILAFTECLKVESSVACLAWKFKTYRKRRSNWGNQDGFTELKQWAGKEKNRLKSWRNMKGEYDGNAGGVKMGEILRKGKKKLRRSGAFDQSMDTIGYWSRMSSGSILAIEL